MTYLSGVVFFVPSTACTCGSMSVLPTDSSAQPVQSVPEGGVRCIVEEFDHTRFPPRDTWLRLFERSRNSRVSHHPDYAQAVLPNIGDPGWIVTCLRGDEPLGMAIMIPKRCRLGRAVLPGARSSCEGVRLAGFGLLGAEEKSVVHQIVQTLTEQIHSRSIPVVEFEEIEEDSILWQELCDLTSAGFRLVPSTDFAAHHRIRLPMSADEYWKTFNSKRRNGLRKERERFGDYELRRVTDAGDVDEWLADAQFISQRSWQTQQFGQRIRNNEEERRFLTFLATMGALRSYTLYREGEPVAFVMGHQWNDIFHYDEVGFDRNLVKLAPGKVLLQEVLDDLMSHDRPDLFDFGLGDGGYKQFFANEQTRSATLWMFPPGMCSSWQIASMQLRKSVSRRARNLLERTGWYETLRRRIRDNAAG